MSRVNYSKVRIKYEIKLDSGKTFSYSVSKYGKYTEAMANISLVTGEKLIIIMKK